MKLTAELMLVPYAPAAATSSARIAGLARAAEEAGFDALGFNDHPAPSRRWLDSGGHEAFDPFSALSFCAAVTSRIRLMPFLTVVPYRNPFLLAKSVATVDKLSEGRMVLCAGTGYLRSEFGSLGADFDGRNQQLEAAIELLQSLWTEEWDGSQVSRPAPVQLPHPPIWIGGNSAASRRRVAAFAEGWSPMLGSEALARTARTATISNADELHVAIDSLRDLLVQQDRDPALVDIQVNGVPHDVGGAAEVAADQYLESIQSLQAFGVTQVVVHLELDDSKRPEETIDSFRTQIVPRLP